MLVRQTCLLQSSRTSQGSYTDELTAVHGARLILPLEKTLTHAQGRPTMSARGQETCTVYHRHCCLEDREVALGFSLSKQALMLEGKGQRRALETSNGLLFRQTPSLKVLARQEDGVHGLEPHACPVSSGSIHLIVGPMFSGKTTALLQRVEEEASAGRRIALVKSDKDTRYGLSAIVSHDGKQMPCWAVPNLASFRRQIGEEDYAKVDLIGIDEAQFLKDLCGFCKAAADYEGKTLIVAGLDGDFERKKFGSILDLVPFADSIVKLSSQCELCGKPALFTFRKTDDTMKEVIGGTDIYMPVCRQHYYSGKVAIEATQTVLNNGKIAVDANGPVIKQPQVFNIAA